MSRLNPLVHMTGQLQYPLSVFFLVLQIAVLQIICHDQVLFTGVEGLPFPAPNLELCENSEECCTPTFQTGPVKKFEFQSHLPMRIRPAAQLVDDAYIVKYQKAYAMLKSLPDSDGRSHSNQAKVHCVYCDNHLYFPGHEYPLEIHNSWLFLVWHRLFIYFHERILAKLLGDDTFALPFWNWDNQSENFPQGNVIPKMYNDVNATMFDGNYSTVIINPLYDPLRNLCSAPPRIVDLTLSDDPCNPQVTDDIQRLKNAHALYTHMVATPATPFTFYGQPYRFGDQGGIGGGTLESKPHGQMHAWANMKEMGTFTAAAKDPIFFAHHGNIDRMWSLWKTLPGGHRDDITDPDWLHTEFTFYDEDGHLVSASVAQALDLDLLRYKYQEVPTPWVTGAVEPGASPNWEFCSKAASTWAAAKSLLESTKTLTNPLNLTSTSGPITFRVERRMGSSRPQGTEEILQLKAKIDFSQQAFFHAYLFFPDVVEQADSEICLEYLGEFHNIPHQGMSSQVPPNLLWQVGVEQKLRDMGRDSLSAIVVTLVGPSASDIKGVQPFLLTSAELVYHTKGKFGTILEPGGKTPQSIE